MSTSPATHLTHTHPAGPMRFGAAWLAGLSRPARRLRGQASLLVPLALLPLYIASALAYDSVDGAGKITLIATVFYCGYAITAVKGFERRLSRRQARFQAEIARRVDEFAPNEVRLSRHYFEMRLAQEIQRGRRHRIPLTVVTLSTPAERDYAVHTSQLVELTARVLRAEDTAGRLGRHVYAICLPHTMPAGASVVIERLQRELDGKPVQFGLAYLRPGLNATPERLLQSAIESPIEAAAVA